MRAMLMTTAGGPDVLQLASNLAVPDLLSPSHLLVRLHAAGVNPIDTKVRKLHMYYPSNLPAVLGCDGAGIVESVGTSVTRFKPGDEVYFFNNGLGSDPGTYADYTVVHEDHLAPKPKNLSMEEAAAVPLVLITAWESLIDRGQLREGHTVLIHAGAGGVGHVAIQLARHIGAFVATTVSNAIKAEFVQSLGAELAINYTKDDFVDAVLDWTEGMGVKLVLDTVGGPTFTRSFAATRVYGRVVTILSTASDLQAVNTARLRNLTIGYVQMTAPLYLGLDNARRAQTRILEEGAKLIEQGKLKVRVSDVFPLERAAEAHRAIEEGHTTGKVVLNIA
ncbi:MAG: zinc-dependent alcohol dehydrogenase family protein [Betaproteobacteria bacterium]|nr:zinc-dependent alcohol dehydrogenase family protein [Betaproteobacteria bacterium]